MMRIDTHQHLIPPDYRNALRKVGIDEAGGRALPDWSPEGSLQSMAELNVATAILSVSTPGTTFLPAAAEAAALAGTSTTTAQISLPPTRISSDSLPPSPCHTSTNPSTRQCALSTT